MLAIVAAAAVVLVALFGWRRADITSERIAWQNLTARQPAEPAIFDFSMVAALPEPARRFFKFAIAPGTRLHTVAEITMEGEFSLGNKSKPDYMPMHAKQILAAPHGFVWKVRAGDRVWFTGSDGAVDGESWSRFWLLGILPVARAGKTVDHLRAAFGRFAAEAVFWTPAALLPGDNLRWEAIDDACCRVVLTHMSLEQAVDLTVDDEGRPVKVVFQRWSNANPENAFQFQPFGGYLSDFKEFNGFRLPTRVEAGNFFETDNYFAFFKAVITTVRFPPPTGQA